LVVVMITKLAADRPKQLGRLAANYVGHLGGWHLIEEASAALGRLTGMAYDQELADRIRRLIGDAPGLTEKKMFGGLAFLIGGNMAIAASGQGGAMVRVDPQQSDALVATTTASVVEMRGRPRP